MVIHAVAKEHVQRAGLGARQPARVGAGGDDVVGIRERDPLALDLAQPRIARRRQAAVLLAQNTQVWHAGGVLREQARRRIGRAVVHRDDLELARRQRLRRQTVQERRKIRCNVVHRHHQAQPGRRAHGRRATIANCR